MPRPLVGKTIADESPEWPPGLWERDAHTKKMKGFLVFIAFVFLVLSLLVLRTCSLKAINAAREERAAEKEKTMRENGENAAIDRSPLLFMAVMPGGNFVRIFGPLTFPAKNPVHLALNVSQTEIGVDIFNQAKMPGARERPDVRIENTTFEVTSNGDGVAKPAPFRTFCKVLPGPSLITVDLELGGNHDVLDSEAKKIYAREIANEIGQVEARSQLEALHSGYVSNVKGTYEIRAIYGHGKLVSAPITVIITD